MYKPKVYSFAFDIIMKKKRNRDFFFVATTAILENAGVPLRHSLSLNMSHVYNITAGNSVVTSVCLIAVYLE